MKIISEEAWKALVEELVRKGLAKRFSVQAICLTGPVDQVKMANFDRAYAEAFNRRWCDRVTKEREADEKFRDFVITY